MPNTRPTAIVVAALAALTLAACSSTADSSEATSTGDADACPGDVLDIVVSVDQWGDVVRPLAGDCGTVTTVINSTAVDPHDYQPTTGDIAVFDQADLVVVNGADYDHWASDALANVDPQPTLVDVADVVGIEEGHSEEGHSEDEEEEHGAVDPHLWYSPDHVQEAAAVITSTLQELDPDAADYFTEQATAWTAQLQPYLDEVAALEASAGGKTYAATETVFDYMAQAVGLTDVTPEGYRSASSNESDPAPGDVAAFESALADGSIDVLVYNTQTEGSVPEQLRSAAESAGVPVVDVTESVPENDPSFVEWQLAQLQQLSAALGGSQ